MEEPVTAVTARSIPNTSQDVSNTQTPDGLTDLHLAVIRNDREGLRHILSTREYGVDARTSNGATPLMMACLFGRTYAFHCLIKKRASAVKKDHQGFSPLDYVKHLPFVKDTFNRYQAFTGQQPSHSGRQTIYSILQTAIQAAHNQQQSAAKEAEPDMPSPAVPVAPAAEDKMETVFFRDGDLLQIAQARILKSAQFNIKLGSKSCAAIRGKFETEYLMMAVSGWGGYKADGALCNKKYSAAVRQLCKEYKLKLPTSFYDGRFNGEPSERSGAYFSCHAEKLLAVWILEECIFHTTQTREVNKDTVANLKILIDQLPLRLRNTVIELDHKPCFSCINFLNLIHEKSGLRIQCSPKVWFIRGTRPRCKLQFRKPNGTQWNNEADVLEVEIDEDFPMASSDNEGHDDFVIVESSPPSSPFGRLDGAAEAAEPLSSGLHPSPSSAEPQRTRQLKEVSSPSSPYSKHASPVREWPSPSVRYRSKTLKNVSAKASRQRAGAAPRGSAKARMAQYLYNPPLPTRDGPEPGAEPAVTSTSSPASPAAQESREAAAPLPVVELSSPVQVTTGADVSAPEARMAEQDEMLDSSILDRPVADPFPGASQFRFSFPGS